MTSRPAESNMASPWDMLLRAVSNCSIECLRFSLAIVISLVRDLTVRSSVFCWTNSCRCAAVRSLFFCTMALNMKK